MPSKRKTDCVGCQVLERENARLWALVERLSAMPSKAPRPAASGSMPWLDAPLAPEAVPAVQKGRPEADMTDQEGRKWVLTPDGTIDTQENYERAMRMLDDTVNGRPAWTPVGEKETTQ